MSRDSVTVAMTSRQGPHPGLRFPPPPPGVPPTGGPPIVPIPADGPLAAVPPSDRLPTELPVVRTSPRVAYRPRSGSGAAWVAVGALAAVSCGLGYVVLRGDVGPRSRTPRGGPGGFAEGSAADSTPPNAAGALAVTPQAVTPQAVTPQAVTPQAVTPQAVTPQAVTPQAVTPQAVTPQAVTPQAVPDPTVPAAVDTAAARGQFPQRIAAAHAALRAGDMPAAAAALDEAAAFAATDTDATERLARWRSLAACAAGFRTQRDQALAAAGRGREYDLEGRVVSVVASRDDELVYRAAGRNERVSRDMIPEPLLLAIVEGWFAGDPQPGNALLLGSYHALKPRPDLRAAEEHWTRAAGAGDETAQALLGILDDPVLRTGSPDGP